MIKSFRKSAASLFTFLFTILFLSCTFIHETKNGRITFSTSKLLQSSARAAGNISNSDFLEVNIFGDYTDSKTISIGDNSPVIFDEVPIDAKVYAEVYIYKLTALQKRYDTYYGKSEELVVKEGDNILNVILKPIEKEVTTSTYAVIHKYQNIDDDEYTVNTDETEKIEGEVSQLTKAQAKAKEGFTAKAFEQKTIQADGSTTVEIYYDRNLHTVTYRAETDDVTDIPDAVQYRYGAPVYINFDSKISRPGYELDGWVTADGNLYKIDGVEYFYMGDEDVIFTAHWAASSDTRYTVKHLQQNIYDDDYTLVETENLRGTSLEYTKAEAKNYPGFTVTYAIAQKPIAEDGSTVIEIKYDRKTACIYYQDGVEAETLDVPVDATIYRYGAEIKIDFSNIGKRNGYTFSGWKDKINDSLFIQDKTEIVTIGTEDITLYAQWTANTYNITYDLNNGSWADSYEAPKTYTYGERQNLPGADKVTRTGYGLTGWYTENGTLLTEIPADMTGNIKLIAQWTAGATRYTVRHWQQNIDYDEYTEIKDDAQILTGISDTSTEAKPNSYTGFTTRENIEQKNISSDGITVVDIYYDRITASIIYDDGVDDENISLPSSNKYRYGANVELDFSTSISRAGYNFTGWLASDGTIYKNGGTTSLTMGITDIILTAQWAPSSNTKYTVIHLQQNVDDDDYTESETETLYGTSLEQTEAKAKSYTGFEAKSVNQESIKADGSTVIEIYYDREIYSVTYNDGLSDENISSKEYRYGANVEIDFTTSVSRTGYNFAGWKTKSGTLYTVDGTSSFKMGTSDVVLTAQWIAASDIKYTVRHMQQNIDDDEYTEIESETLEGTSLEQTKATAKTYPGFTAQSVSQTTINPDGTSVVEIKYDRKTVHLYYQDGVDGSIEVPADAIYRYGANIKLDFTNIGKRTGYTFSHWKDTTSDSDFVPGDSETITIGTDDITLYAQWTANIYNITYDLNNGSWADDYIAASTYTYGLRQNLPGADKVLRSGYGLAGWYTENGTLLSEISADMTGDIKLIAQWTAGASTYTVRHWQQAIDNNEYIEIKDDAQVQTGISEADTSAKANSYKGFIAKDFEQKSIASDGSTVIDIYYDRITNSIIYEDGLADEEISIPESKQYRYGVTATIDFTTPVTRPGYDFVGWQTSDGTIYKSDGITSITMGETNITLTAMWTRQTYKVTFNSMGGSQVEQQAVLYEAKAVTPIAPTKTGYQFIGWFTSDDDGITLSTSTFDFDTQITDNLTLYAKWSSTSITVSITNPDDSSVEITAEGIEAPDAKELIFYIKNWNEKTLYKWYLDGLEVTDSTEGFYLGSANSVTMYKDSFVPGTYVLTLTSGIYSSSITIEIKAN